MSSPYRPRRPRASPLWQIVHHSWTDFLAEYESRHRRTLGPLRHSARATVNAFSRCGDLAAGFTRLHCPDCGHQRLLAFTCKGRHFCPACHQRRALVTGDWIARSLCRPVPHRQFVFTMPRPLRGIFRKRRELLHHLFRTAVDTLRDWFRIRLDLPDGRLAAVAAVHTFGDYLVFHPHLHVLAACGLFDREGCFHLLPVESLEPLAGLFRHRFLAVLRQEKLISEKRLRQLLGWAHSGFHLDAGKEPVAAGDVEGRRRLAEYLLRAPFSLQKITWKPETATVIYRSRRNWRTKRNFEVFKATDFLAAAVDHIPPKSRHTIRYYGVYSNKSRGMERRNPPESPPPVVAAPHASSARALRPLWRDLIMRVWGADPLECPECNATMRAVDTFFRPEEIEFFLRLLGLWEGIIDIPPPPAPPFDVETMEPIEPPPGFYWPEDDDPDAFQLESLDPSPWEWPQSPAGIEDQPAWKAPELKLDDERILVLDGDDAPGTRAG